MQITTKHLLHFLPIEEPVKKQAMAQFDRMSPDQQLEIRKLCWSMFFELLKTTVQATFVKKLAEAKNDATLLKNDLYREVEKKVYQDFMDKLAASEQAIGLGEIRQELQQTLATKIAPSQPATDQVISAQTIPTQSDLLKEMSNLKELMSRLDETIQKFNDRLTQFEQQPTTIPN